MKILGCFKRSGSSSVNQISDMQIAGDWKAYQTPQVPWHCPQNSPLGKDIEIFSRSSVGWHNTSPAPPKYLLDVLRCTRQAGDSEAPVPCGGPVDLRLSHQDGK